MEKRPYHMAKCRDCGTIRKVTRTEWTRRSPPRCIRCGGLVEMTDAGKDDFLDAFRLGKATTVAHIKEMTNRS